MLHGVAIDVFLECSAEDEVDGRISVALLLDVFFANVVAALLLASVTTVETFTALFVASGQSAGRIMMATLFAKVLAAFWLPTAPPQWSPAGANTNVGEEVKSLPLIATITTSP